MPPRVEKLERVADLLFCLLHTSEPLTLVEIASQVPGYPDEPEARRTQFERDKRTLRESGVPITVSSPNGSGQDGYRILAAEYYLPDLGLAPDERDALALALATVRLEGVGDAEVAVKIGAAPVTPGAALVELPRLPALGRLAEAIRRRATVDFSYRGRDRRVEPYALGFRYGNWYLLGRDRTAPDDGRRTFRVDRIPGTIRLGDDADFEPATDLDVSGELAFSIRAQGPEPQLVVELAVEQRARSALAAVAPAGEPTRRDGDGRVIVGVPVNDLDALISYVVGFGADLEVLGPPEVRDAVAERLGTLAADRGVGLDSLDGRFSEQPPAPARRPALDAGARLRRLLAILTYLAGRGSERIDALAERFSLSESELVRELELAACFGVPPYTPDQLLDIVVSEEMVEVHRLESLERPLRLTAEEGFVLAAAARTLLRIQGTDDGGPLARALESLERALGEDRVHIEIERPEHLEVLRAAAASNTVVEISYLASGRAEPTRRVIEPVAISFREGRFYLDAFCRLANDWRRFIVANVQSVSVTGEHGAARTPPAAFAGPRAFVDGASSVRAVIVAPSWARSQLEAFSSLPAVGLEDDRVLVSVSVGDEEWLGRLLCRLGPGAQVVSPSWLRRAKIAVATQALSRYEQS